MAIVALFAAFVVGAFAYFGSGSSPPKEQKVPVEALGDFGTGVFIRGPNVGDGGILANPSTFVVETDSMVDYQAVGFGGMEARTSVQPPNTNRLAQVTDEGSYGTYASEVSGLGEVAVVLSGSTTISNWGSGIAGTGATLGFPGTGPVNPLAISTATYDGVAIAYHVNDVSDVTATGAILATTDASGSGSFREVNATLGQDLSAVSAQLTHVLNGIEGWAVHISVVASVVFAVSVVAVYAIAVGRESDRLVWRFNLRILLATTVAPILAPMGGTGSITPPNMRRKVFVPALC